MAEYIINEANFDPVNDIEKIQGLEDMIESHEIPKVNGIVSNVSYRKLESMYGKLLYGPNLVVLLNDRKEPAGIAFEGDRKNMEALFKGYNISSLGSMLHSNVTCYLDPESRKIFAIEC